MKICRTSQMTGAYHEREIAVEPQQVYDWQNGKGYIQDIMPNVSANDREFLMTGTTPEEWNEAFGDEP